MDSIFERCRHRSVSWLDTHNCRCEQCGKYGRWFENPKLVMWHRSNEPAPDFAIQESIVLSSLSQSGDGQSLFIAPQYAVGEAQAG